MRSAIILAGGQGERLRPYTEDRPKPMIPVLGNPLISFQLKLLAAHQIGHVVICCGYQHEVIQKYFGDGSNYGVKIEYLVETEPLGRGGALRNAMEHINPSEPLLALNGDTITNLDLTNLFKFHSEENLKATLVSVPYKSSFGIVEFSGDLVSDYEEKPELPLWINAGIYILSPQVVSDLPKVGDHEILTFPKLIQEKQLRAYKTRCFWKSVETIKDLTELRKEFEQLIFGAFLQVS